MKYNRTKFWLAIAAAFWLAVPVLADTLIASRDGKEVSLTGELLFEALDKSILFETADGQLHVFAADNIVSVEKEAAPPAMKHEELAKSLLADPKLPQGMKTLATENYVIAYKTEVAFAKWIAKLYEKRLISEFEKFAKNKLQYKLNPAEFPLAIIVFGTRPEYDAYAARELGVEPGSMIAHYSPYTNRVAMYDLTFDLGRPGVGQKLEQKLQQKAAIPMVTTIIHEGTHQLMFNRGMQVRLADAPLWLNEGIANWFETPDLRSNNGWTRPGAVNRLRLRRLSNYMPKRPANSIETLIADDERFNFADEKTFDAYAESWALVHFLLKRRTRKFRDYLKAISTKKPGFQIDAETRLKDFTDHFGDLKKLDSAFLKYVRTLR